jgi:26S proteasome regulatory subunit N5
VAAAADIMQEVHVETYGSLSKIEKIDFILEQMRLTLEKKDYVRVAIVSNKINQKAIAEEGMEDKKIKYFLLMAQLHSHENDAFQLAKDYYSIYCTTTVQASEDRWKEALQNTVVYLSLSPYSMEQQNMLKRINTDTNLEKVTACRDTVKCFLKSELISLPFIYQVHFESFQAFTSGDEEMKSFWRKSLRKRIIEHNIRVAAKYYSRIKGRRLAELLGIDAVELESELSSMVNNRDVYAKFDRPSDIIRFAPTKTPEVILSDWSHDISTLLNLVETTTHLIHKETTTQ